MPTHIHTHTHTHISRFEDQITRLILELDKRLLLSRRQIACIYIPFISAHVQPEVGVDVPALCAFTSLQSACFRAIR